MIGRLKGVLLEKAPPQLLLDVNGVGYEVEASMATFYLLPELGKEVLLYTHLLVREDAQLLYGFATPAERQLFRSLIKVSGVGAKLALGVLSGISSDDFATCIHSGDVKTLVKLPGIGKKTAERLIIEMRDRLEKELKAFMPTPVLPGGAVATAHPTVATPLDQALSALLGLGYKPAEAERMVKRLNTEGLTTEEIIRQALKASLS